jgi:hypothetical protein
MKRLVYSPSINVWIKTDTGVFDLSPYVTGFNIDRRVQEVSAARVTFRNPRVTDERNPKKTRFMFTEHYSEGGVRPMFHPMDPIIITLTRLKGRPIQVFTGYCDTTPYVQLLPGEATLTASCTLKRLIHTYWDPALPFIRDFLQTNGWDLSVEGVAFNPKTKPGKTLNDGSLGLLLYKVLTEIGRWDSNNIFIQNLPGSQISTMVRGLYKDVADEVVSSTKELDDFMYGLIGASKYGSAGGSGGGGNGGAGGAALSEPESVDMAIPEKENGIEYWRDRSGSPKIIVLHSTDTPGLVSAPGTAELTALRNGLMGQTGLEGTYHLSVHVGVDPDGNAAKYVDGDKLAHHVYHKSDIALGIEQIGFSTQTSWPDKQIDKVAEWVAYWSSKYDIPLTKSATNGICGHGDLGTEGGNHGDPGPNYPFDKVIQKAKQIVDNAAPSGGQNRDSYNKQQLKELWISNGGKRSAANIAAAVAIAESGGDPKNRGPQTGTNTDGSVDWGLWQINNKAHPDKYPNGSEQDMLDPNKNCRAAIEISSNGTNWRPWTTYNTNKYRDFL